MIKKALIGAGLMLSATGAMAYQPGGPDCGWGNMLFSGQKGLVMHTLASITNRALTSNDTLGMTLGTNGCSTEYALSYGGKSWLNVSAVMDEFAEDVARGDGEAMNAVAVSLGVQREDRDHFAAVMHSNFDRLFPQADVTAEQVMGEVVALMRDDEKLAKYLG